MTIVGAYEAKTRLAELLDKVAQGERVVITRHGVPVATLQAPDPGVRGNIESLVAEVRRFRKGRKIPWNVLKEMAGEGRD